MEIAFILTREVLVLFLLVAAGIICRKTGILDDHSAKKICDFLLMAVIPVLIIRSFQQEKRPELMTGFWVTFVTAIIIHIIFILVAVLVIKPNGKNEKFRVQRLAAIYSNSGFMGIPLLMATVGEVALLYAAVFISVQSLVNWTWGARNMSGDKRLSVLALCKNPNIIAFAVGLTMFLLEIRLPYVLYSFCDFLYGINTPMSAIAIGVFLAAIKIKHTLCDISVYKVMLLRNLLLPLITLLILRAVNLAAWFPDARTVAICIMIMCSSACAITAILMTAKYGQDSHYGAELVAVSTLFSIITLPFMIFLTQILL